VSNRSFDQIVLSCEHASKAVPKKFEHLLPSKWLLDTHQGWDIGALELARTLAKSSGAALHAARWTRLLVDLNRDEGQRNLHGPAIRKLTDAQKIALVEQIHRPYREQVYQQVQAHLQQELTVLHLSVHSFTPRLRGQVRPLELGIMYDPARPAEQALAEQWQRQLAIREPRLRVLLNQPYHGADPYFQSYLRRHLRSTKYLGLQIEINQKLPRQQPKRWLRLQQHLQALLHA
jgi:predicted N-formylglutamate amidohydrolase